MGLPKKVQEYVFFQIKDVNNFKKKLALFIPQITTMAQVIKDYDQINANKALGIVELLKLSGTNISFSQFGLTKVIIYTRTIK